jgi:hypothetical protein
MRALRAEGRPLRMIAAVMGGKGYRIRGGGGVILRRRGRSQGRACRDRRIPARPAEVPEALERAASNRRSRFRPKPLSALKPVTTAYSRACRSNRATDGDPFKRRLLFGHDADEASEYVSRSFTQRRLHAYGVSWSHFAGIPSTKPTRGDANHAQDRPNGEGERGTCA